MRAAPDHPAPWRVRALPLWRANDAPALPVVRWLLLTNSIDARCNLWPLIVAIAILGHPGPVHGLHDRSRRLVGSGLRWSSLIGRVLAPAGTNFLGG